MSLILMSRGYRHGEAPSASWFDGSQPACHHQCHMDEPFSGLLFHEDDASQGMVLTCVWCEAALVASAIPDERTTALWLNRCCRSCGDRYDLNAVMP
jgi:hypothetical protein